MLRVLSQALLSIVFIFFALPVSADSTRVGDLIIESPWARASIGTSRPAAAYMTIRNVGKSADVLFGVETSVSGMSEVHKMEMKDGVANMGPAGPIEIPAGAVVELAPGGLHVMLMKLQKPLKKGEGFSMTLVFEKAGRINIAVPIYGIGASGPQD